jgi:hypothetical protein
MVGHGIANPDEEADEISAIDKKEDNAVSRNFVPYLSGISNSHVLIGVQ